MGTTDEKVLVLQALQEPPAAPDLDLRSIHAADPLTFRLKLKADGLVGFAYSRFPNTPLLWPMFKEVTSTPQELADAKKRDQAALRKNPEPPMR